MRALLTAAVIVVAGCSSAGRISELQTGPISLAHQDRLLVECEALFHANGQTAEACPNIIEGTVWEAQHRGCGYLEAAKFLRALLRVPGESGSGDDVVRRAQAGLPNAC